MTDLTATVHIPSLRLDVHMTPTEATLVRNAPGWPLLVERYPMDEFIRVLRTPAPSAP